MRKDSRLSGDILPGVIRPCQSLPYGPLRSGWFVHEKLLGNLDTGSVYDLCLCHIYSHCSRRAGLVGRSGLSCRIVLCTGGCGLVCMLVPPDTFLIKNCLAVL